MTLRFVPARDCGLVVGIVAPVMCLVTAAGSAAGRAEAADAAFTLWQLPEQTHTQMMSYVLRTATGTVIVIDGGTKGDAPYLRKFLKKQGGDVEAWILTHPHSDHCHAMTDILAHPDGISVRRLYASLPPDEWLRTYEPEAANDAAAVREAARSAGLAFNQMVPGQILLFDGVRVEVLGVKNEEIHVNAINNSSLVLRVSDSQKSVLFLGDLGAEGGEKLLKSRRASQLRSDYVQMAHHGQNGVTEEFYKAVQPSYCLWTTPDWLWSNDQGNGPNTGPWRTLEVRGWMDKHPIKKHFVTSIDGLVRVD